MHKKLKTRKTYFIKSKRKESILTNKKTYFKCRESTSFYFNI